MFARKYEMPWRQAYEAYAAAGWVIVFGYFATMVVLGRSSIGLMLALTVACLAMAALRAAQALHVFRLRASLSGKAMETMDSGQLATLCHDEDRVWLGYGFEWTPVHAQRLYELTKLNVRDFAVPRCLQRWLGFAEQAQPDDEVGLPFIHGVEPREIPLFRPLDNFQGGTLLAGTTQSGKGVFLTILETQAIRRGDVVIIIDPKNSKRMKNNVIRACREAGREPPLEFHPAFPERGVRLDPMFNWQKPTELASRIQSIMPPDTSGAFAAFGWSAVNTVVQGCVEIEDRPNLLKIAQYIEGGIEPVLEKSLERFFDNECGSDWREKYRAHLKRAQDGKSRRPSETASDKLVAYVDYYTKEVSAHKRSKAIDSQIQVFTHNRDHYSKITANLLPILSMLTSGSLGKSLAPDPFDVDDPRPIMNLDKVVRGGHVLYMALDSLPDPSVASAIGAIFLADLAALSGMRYNLGHDGRRISLFVDEVANTINAPLIEILNKGAESGIYATCAMQTLADLAKRLGSEDAARMVLGNLNNLIALRSKDRPTQDYICETFGKTYIQSVSVGMTTIMDETPQNFKGTVSRTMSQAREEIVPADILGKLPNLQYFALVSGGRLIKGRIPILNPDATRDAVTPALPYQRA